MFNTGYTMKPHEIPVQWQDDTIQTLTSLASGYDLTICGSIPMFKNNNWYNTMVTVSKEDLSTAMIKYICSLLPAKSIRGRKYNLCFYAL